MHLHMPVSLRHILIWRVEESFLHPSYFGLAIEKKGRGKFICQSSSFNASPTKTRVDVFGDVLWNSSFYYIAGWGRENHVYILSNPLGFYELAIDLKWQISISDELKGIPEHAIEVSLRSNHRKPSIRTLDCTWHAWL
jgi:hypothetical protein